ncbi:hypothetical protein FQN49_000095 [Arthroderma sp. PD_2]|nr:hypothetical protein FQN49_000095 [Arthroderma sp. PD_2]
MLLNWYDILHDPAAHWSRFEQSALTRDPFIVECQVYDFLIEKGLSGVVGPECYGWLTLDGDQEHYLSRKPWGVHEWHRRVDTANDPIRGLLLEYIEGQTLDKAYITPIEAQSLRDQLKHLHSMDIAHGDFYLRNIMVSKDGRVQGRAVLIDFSSAILWPYSPTIRKREKFLSYIKNEKATLELILFRLQQLKRHHGVKLTEAQSEEEAFGRRVSEWMDTNYRVLE